MLFHEKVGGGRDSIENTNHLHLHQSHESLHVQLQNLWHHNSCTLDDLSQSTHSAAKLLEHLKLQVSKIILKMLLIDVTSDYNVLYYRIVKSQSSHIRDS